MPSDGRMKARSGFHTGSQLGCALREGDSLGVRGQNSSGTIKHIRSMLFTEEHMGISVERRVA